jgi:hypothetical protein
MYPKMPLLAATVSAVSLFAALAAARSLQQAGQLDLPHDETKEV